MCLIYTFWTLFLSMTIHTFHRLKCIISTNWILTHSIILCSCYSFLYFVSCYNPCLWKLEKKKNPLWQGMKGYEIIFIPLLRTYLVKLRVLVLVTQFLWNIHLVSTLKYFHQFWIIFKSCFFQDVPYKPVEFSVKTRKCEPDASAKVVKVCERQVSCLETEFHLVMVLNCWSFSLHSCSTCSWGY